VGAITVVVNCDAAARVSATGLLTEITHPRRGRSRTLRLHLTTATASVAAGVSRTLVLKLPVQALSGLTARNHESATLTLTATDAAGTSRRTTTITTLRGR
jgi:hypothetical protein